MTSSSSVAQFADLWGRSALYRSAKRAGAGMGVLLDRVPRRVLCPWCDAVFEPDEQGVWRGITITTLTQGYLVLPCDRCLDESAKEAEREAAARMLQEDAAAACKKWGLEDPELEPPLSGLNERLERLAPGGPLYTAYLVGKPGTGKTRQATLALRWLAARRGLTSAFCVTEDVAWETLTSRERGKASAFKAKLLGVQTLILDELGRFADKQWKASAVAAVLWGRHRRRRVTIITSNKSLAQIARMPGYDEGLVRRIWEGSGDEAGHWAGTGTYLELDWNYRRGEVVELPPGCLGRAG